MLEVESTRDGRPLAGTRHVAPRNGVAALQLDGEGGRWRLRDLDCDGAW